MSNSIEDYWKTNQNQYRDNPVEWMNWFDKCESINEYQKTGMIDFYHKIFTENQFYQILGDPGSKNAFEIGVGAGRLTNASCKIFKHVYGIDIHESLDKTSDLLSYLRNDNFTLYKYNKDKFEDLQGKIDFVYSFIVFQHFENWETAKNYIDLIELLLSKNGCGKIFFGINNIDDSNYLERGLYEEQAMSLCVKPQFIKEVFEEKFNIISMGITTKKPWNQYPSGQFYISFSRK